MNKNEYAKKLTDVAQKLGFSAPIYNGSGHYTLTHPNGETCSVASTPSEYRTWTNIVAMLERISGQKLDRPQHRRSHKKNQVSGYLDTFVSDSQLAARRQFEIDSEVTQNRVNELLEEHKSIKVLIAVMTSGPCTNTEKNKAVKLLRRIIHIEDVLTELDQTFESYTPIPKKYSESES